MGSSPAESAREASTAFDPVLRYTAILATNKAMLTAKKDDEMRRYV